MRIRKEVSKILRLNIRLLLIVFLAFSLKVLALTYTVKKGDSLDKIARKYGVSVKSIIKANHLKKPYIIRPGQKLKIPTKKSRIRAYKIYKVRPGDSLIKIAKKFGVSTKDIIKANRLKKPYRLRAGQKLKIPVKYTKHRKKRKIVKRKVKQSYTVSYCTRKYRVRPGDSLAKIAKKFGLSVKTLKRINNLKSSTIRVGQTLCVKKVSKKVSRRLKNKIVRTRIIYYKVRPGDSLIKIAKKFHVYTKDIIRANRLKKPYRLRVGQKLKIPKKEIVYIKREEEEFFTEIPKNSIKFGFIWPVEGEVVKNFVNNETMRHLGIDIATDCGANIKAAESGKVIYSGDSIKPYGKLIIIRHKGKFSTVYGHVGNILVRENQYVRKGQIIGTVGKLDDNMCGLYFEIRKNTVPVDPLVFLEK